MRNGDKAMNVEIPVIGQEQDIQKHSQKPQSTLIKSRDIKAILYLGIRGKISLPIEKHKVDILV